MSLPIALHPVNRAKRGNRYCGPACISILTGLDTTDCARLLRFTSGQRAIYGIGMPYMKPALRLLGYTVQEVHNWRGIPAHKRPTLSQWGKTRANEGSYLISAGHHWSLVHGGMYACGVSRKPVPFVDSPYRRTRVAQVWALTRHADIDPATAMRELPATDAETYALQTADRLAVKRLAEPFSIDVDDSNRDKDDPTGTIWVYPGEQWPEGLADPFDDEHFHDDWASARKAVETYIAAIEAFRKVAVAIGA